MTCTFIFCRCFFEPNELDTYFALRLSVAAAAAVSAAAVHLEESLKRKSFWPEGILFWSR